MKIANMPSICGGPHPNNPKRIIIHSIGEFIDTEGRDYYCTDWLEYLKISAHAFITPSGVVIKTRNSNQRAYHSKGNNRDTIGIEFMVPGLHNYVTFSKAIRKLYLTDIQYKAGVEYVKFLMDGISLFQANMIFRHSEIDPSRKIDPGAGFPWKQFLKDLAC